MNWKQIRYWTWELPQTLLGISLLMFYEKTRLKTFRYKDHDVYIYDKFPGGISLGKYILLDYNRWDYNNNIIRQSLKDSVKHEYGHTCDSAWQGPFYLLFTGLLSSTWLIVRRIINKYRAKKNLPLLNYYWFITERRADNLGSVIRNHEKYLE